MRPILTLIFIVSLIVARGQGIDIKPYLRAWKVSGVNQSLEAQKFYDSLKINRDISHYKNVVKALHAYLENNDDRRLRVRTMMYEAFGAREYGLLPIKENEAIAMDAIKLAYPLRDEQLNAELYALCTDMTIAPYDYIFYNLKAIEIQRKIGFSHFAYVQNRFFGASDILYKTGEYQQSIKYGKEGLRLWNIDINHCDRRIYIVQMDIIGASYKKLGILDSAYYYYQKIYDSIRHHPLEEPDVQKIWMGISKGNLGQKFAQHKDYAKALPLMREYLRASIETKDSFNIAIAHNELGKVFFDQQQYSQALSAWQQAAQISEVYNFIDQIIPAYNGIASVFRKMRKPDSAFYYYDKYERSKEKMQEFVRESNYANVSAHVAFDNLKNSFDKMEFQVIRIRNIRNAIIAGITLLTIIVMLLYNRKRLKHAHKLNEAKLQYEVAQANLTEAKEKITAFTKNNIEKDAMINAMMKKNRVNDSAQKQELENSLQQYMFVSEDDWLAFRSDFVKIYPRIPVALRQKAERLTQAEERLAILIFLQLGNGQIVQTLGISRESVARSKRRLKTRFCLSAADSLEDFVAGL